jgi:YHS domain-containing protein
MKRLGDSTGLWRRMDVLIRFLSRIMRFLFLLVMAIWIFAMLRRALAWILGGTSTSGSGRQSQSASDLQPASRRLVRDPVCGVHVAEYRAIPLRESGQVLHFCSTACRDQYLGSQKKLAANG